MEVLEEATTKGEKGTTSVFGWSRGRRTTEGVELLRVPREGTVADEKPDSEGGCTSCSSHSAGFERFDGRDFENNPLPPPVELFPLPNNDEDRFWGASTTNGSFEGGLKLV